MTRKLWGGCALLLLSLLLGCATGPGGGSGNDRDWVTESDEAPARKRARVRLELASGYFEQGQYVVALDEVKQALGIDPSYASAHNLRGLIYMRLSEPSKASDSFQQALRYAPQDGDTWHNLGWLHCQESRAAEAKAAFQRALQSPHYAQAARSWMAQGICEARAGQKPEAERSLLRSFDLDPANPITVYNLAMLMHGRGESERARHYLRRLNNSDMANAESLWLGLKIENRLMNHEASRQLGDQLRRRFPESREAGAYERGAFNE